jgi:phosphoribosylamine--glycine ligase
MRVLVVGQGGREHAICWKLKQSRWSKRSSPPRERGIATVADCVEIGVADIIELADFAEKLRSTSPWSARAPPDPRDRRRVPETWTHDFWTYAACCRARGFEGLLQGVHAEVHIPTAEAIACNSVDEAKDALKKTKFPAVLKLDGWRPGKASSS